MLIYPPGVPILLGVLAIAQMGVHLVFFLHISSAPDQTNNILALAFGIFVVGLLVFGSMIIMAHLNHNMMPMDRLMQMQRVALRSNNHPLPMAIAPHDSLITALSQPRMARISCSSRNPK